MDIRYSDSVETVSAVDLVGFFQGWPNCPDEEKHLQILVNSYKVWLAQEGDRVIGFINAISDGVYAAHIPLLEVLPNYQGRGIGKELTRRMLESLSPLYSIDIVCDEALKPFYEKHELRPCYAMVKRNYQNQ